MLYNQAVVCCLFATLVITASSHSKCCPADQTRPDKMIKMIKMIQDEVTERGVRKFSALKKNRVPDMGGGECFFSSSGRKKTESKKSGDSLTVFPPPCLGL